MQTHLHPTTDYCHFEPDPGNAGSLSRNLMPSSKHVTRDKRRKRADTLQGLLPYVWRLGRNLCDTCSLPSFNRSLQEQKQRPRIAPWPLVFAIKVKRAALALR